MTVVERQVFYGNSSGSGSAKGNIIEGTKIIGTVELANGMQVDGEIKGKIYSDGEIFLGASSKIEGNVVTRKIKVSGNVVGDILAEERIELCVPAVVKGNIAAPKIVIQDGVVFSGGCEMQNPEDTVRINS
jgi:cytoskeletal protein CcmA (bactofilin family)